MALVGLLQANQTTGAARAFPPFTSPPVVDEPPPPSETPDSIPKDLLDTAPRHWDPFAYPGVLDAAMALRDPVREALGPEGDIVAEGSQ